MFALVAVVVLAGLVLAVLAAPVVVRWEIDTVCHPAVEVRLSFLRFATVAYDRATVARRIAHEAEPPKVRTRARLQQGRRLRAMLFTEGFIREIELFARRVWRAIVVSETTLHARVGLDNPADTGVLWGGLTPIVLLADSTPHDVWIVPCFEYETLEVRGHGAIRTVPLVILAIAIRFLLRPPTLRALAAARRAT